MTTPEYQRICKTCNETKHLSLYYRTVKLHCIDCQKKKTKKSKLKNAVKNVWPISHTFNKYTRELHDKEKA